MMIDLVYPLGPGSFDNNFELTNSILTVLKYMTGVRNIYIIGEQYTDIASVRCRLPEPTDNTDYAELQRNGGLIINLPFSNEGHNPQDRIRRKFEFACHLDEISDPFLAMNDDYFLRGPIHAPNYPYYHYRTLPDAYNHKRKPGHYKRAVENTINVLKELGLSNLHYDIHVPIRYEKRKFIHVMDGYNWRLKDSFIIKSLYCNTLRMSECPEDYGPPNPLEDCNINHFTATEAEIETFIPPGRNLFAVGQYGLNDVMKGYIQKLL